MNASLSVFLVFVSVGILGAERCCAEELPNRVTADEIELKPILTRLDGVVLEGDFSKPRKTLDEAVWKNLLHTRWFFEDGVLRGLPSTKEYQRSVKHHQGFEPRLSLPTTPKNFALRVSFRFIGGEEANVTPYIEFGHHVVRVHFSADGARLLVAAESLLVGEAKDFRPGIGDWIDAFVEVRGDEFVVQFAGGPTLYARHAGIAGEKDGFGLAGTAGGTVEVRRLTIHSVKAEAADGWAGRREEIVSFEPVPIVKPIPKKRPGDSRYLTEEEFEIDGLPKQKYHFDVDYKKGTLQRVDLAGSLGYVIEPTGRVDPERRWVWIVPLWLVLPSAYGNSNAWFYVEGLLEAGFHVAGFDVGASLGSPKGAELFRQFHDHVVENYRLAPKTRMMAVSNGGLITYGYAFRNPERVDRIFAIYPALDFRSWPKFHLVVGPAAITPKGVSYEMTAEELREKIEDFNPIDNLAPLAREGVPLLHFHGDADELVPMDPNSTVAVERYRRMGGDIVLKIMPGSGHGGTEFFTDGDALKFLLGASNTDADSRN